VGSLGSLGFTVQGFGVEIDGLGVIQKAIEIFDIEFWGFGVLGVSFR